MVQMIDPEEVARFENATWSRCARSYTDGFGALTGETIKPLLDEGQVSRSSRVLDVGTGTGLVAAAAAQRGADVVGIDFSDAMLAEARRLHPEIEYHAASIDALPFAAGTFDAVIGNFVLHHAGRPAKVLEEAFRVLRPGGKVVHTVWADPSKLEAIGLFFAAVTEHAGTAELPNGPLFGISDFDVFHQMLRDAGFRDSSVRELRIVWRMRTIDSFLAAFGDWAQLDTFPTDIRDRIDATVRERAVAYRTSDGFAIPNPAILLSAAK
jgi:ubiquinone/menaquinone biosynthesis C-methylase UbiE